MIFKGDTMEATISKLNYPGQPAELDGVVADTAVKMESVDGSAVPWYCGIVPDDNSPTRGLNVQVVDKGSSMEFILPRKTAQFVEMAVLNTRGMLVWKTQSFNKNTIVWHKQTTFGERVPRGKYLFRLKQGNRQVSGSALVA
jgi:hypothetical protein